MNKISWYNTLCHTKTRKLTTILRSSAFGTEVGESAIQSGASGGSHCLPMATRRTDRLTRQQQPTKQSSGLSGVAI